MPGAILNTLRLARAGFVLAQYGVRFVPAGVPVPLPLKIARAATLPIEFLSAPFQKSVPRSTRVATALTKLGPSYVKLGQFLATRADVIGPELSADLRHLQDKAEPFSMAEARETVERALGGKLEDHFVEFGPPVAAASIAQVHKAYVLENGIRKAVAVKILRPNIEKRFNRDLDSYYFAAQMIERFYPPARRLKPVAVVDNLKHTTVLEMDLRLEAAAISEMAANTTADDGFRVPTIDWKRTAKRVLTVEWIDGTPISHRETLQAKGFDTAALGLTVLRSFLRHAMRDGFFHADMHQGNLFVDDKGMVVAVDFGIMGRLGLAERRFLAEILHGLITRDYHRAAAIHFEAGYVPSHHTVEEFAQAMRAIGEPIQGRTAEEISMADLLGQLFAYTEVFDMETRPELILLQKSMVIVEGVARDLDPSLNVWVAAEPVAKEWMEANLSPLGRLREAGRGAESIGEVLLKTPALLQNLAQAITGYSEMARSGVRLDDQTIENIASRSKRSRAADIALWIGALSLAVIAVKLFGFF
ncbi:2-polyprenylphenol 6-hydroxylase [Hyphomicrobium sp.]|uniref:2-polyprenylphenol 6-hydroxylase n=1 Tax=Hyphomicrobium sp. TaxID=82 RepID=UPI001D76157C|nr:2-polyprenylphenol 6-hydroxylase [Hyphomicrobium sp.]MBY0562286.1 2-polyprenylphenol 6-hydroxylase [Hyphomicrobium sp.]